MKLSLMDLQLILSAIDFNLEVLEDNTEIDDEIGQEYIEKLGYVRDEIKEEINIIITTKYEYEL